MDEVLRVENLHKRFGPLHVLRGIDLSVRKGETVVILGASGSGKSTLLRCLNFLEMPSEGRITIEGRLVVSYANAVSDDSEAEELFARKVTAADLPEPAASGTEEETTDSASPSAGSTPSASASGTPAASASGTPSGTASASTSATGTPVSYTHLTLPTILLV